MRKTKVILAIVAVMVFFGCALVQPALGQVRGRVEYKEYQRPKLEIYDRGMTEREKQKLRDRIRELFPSGYDDFYGLLRKSSVAQSYVKRDPLSEPKESAVLHTPTSSTLMTEPRKQRPFARDRLRIRALGIQVSNSLDPDQVLNSSRDVEVAIKNPQDNSYLTKLVGSAQWFKIMPQQEPLSMSGDKLPAELGSAYFFILAGGPSAGAKVVKLEPSRGPPAGSKFLEIVSGDIKLHGLIDAQSGSIYLPLKDLPEAVKKEPVLLSRNIWKDDLAQIRKAAKTNQTKSIYYQRQEKSWEHDLREAGKNLVQLRLKEAVQKMPMVPAPEDRQGFLEECNWQRSRLSGIFLTNFDRLIDYRYWQRLVGDKSVPPCRLVPVSVGSSLDVIAFPENKIVLSPNIQESKIKENDLLYVQDSPSLHNLDANISMGTSLPQPVKGSIETINLLRPDYKIEGRPDIAHYLPLLISSPDGMLYRRAGPYRSWGKIYIPYNHPPCNQPPCDNDGESDIYVISAKKSQQIKEMRHSDGN